MHDENRNNSSRLSPLFLLSFAVLAPLVLFYAAAAGARRLAVSMLLPAMSSIGVPPRLAPELSPWLQLREREEEPRLAIAYLRALQDRYPDRRFVLLLGASEAGHHGCNRLHCITSDLTGLLPSHASVINLTRRGQTIEESTEFLERISREVDPRRFAFVVTINPIFFATPGAVFPEFTATLPAAGSALLADRAWRQNAGEGTASARITGRLEERLAEWFGFAFFRRALFRHRLGVSPVGVWRENWTGPIGPALLPGPNPAAARKIKPRPVAWSFYLAPGFGPAPQRDWRSYYKEGRVDLDFASRRMHDLQLSRVRPALLRMDRLLRSARAARAATLIVRTPLNPGMLALLDERSNSTNHKRNHSYDYADFIRQWRSFKASLATPVFDLDDLPETDFVDLDHLAPSGQARMAVEIYRNLELSAGDWLTRRPNRPMIQ